MGLFDFLKKKTTTVGSDKDEIELPQPAKTLESFFKIDIHNALGLSTNVKIEDNKYLSRLNSPEMGIFNQLRIIYFPDTKKANLQFLSDNMVISEPLKELLAFLTNQYGLDSVAKRGYFEEIERGMLSFMRLWPNIAMVTAINGYIELTLFDIHQN